MDPPTKDAIKTWIDQKDDGYRWLAKELAVSYQTVRAWMSTRAIPQKKLERIAELMSIPEAEQKHLEYDEERKCRVKEWLKATAKNREWLACELGLSLVAINKWFDRRIPDGRYAQIEALMRSSSEPQFSRGIELSPFSVEVITARLTKDEYACVLQCCKAECFGEDLESWLRACILDRVKEVLPEAASAISHPTRNH